MIDSWLNMGRSGPYASAQEALDNLPRDVARMKDHCHRWPGYDTQGFMAIGPWELGEVHLADGAGGWTASITHKIKVQKA